MRTGLGIMLLGMAITLGLSESALARDAHCDDNVGERASTTPDSDFAVLGNGVVQHRPSGLQWAQCAIGQRVAGSTCIGNASVFNWDEARQAVEQLNRSGELAGNTDWRLPTVEELTQLVEKCREAPSINTSIFPNTPWTGFWTSTLHYDGKDRLDNHDPEHVEVDAKSGAHPDDDDEDRERPSEAWFVGFYKGLEYPYDVASSYRVRVVRNP